MSAQSERLVRYRAQPNTACTRRAFGFASAFPRALCTLGAGDAYVGQHFWITPQTRKLIVSILLSAYYPEGIVFVADKNATITVSTSAGDKRFVEPTLTKVLEWPRNRAVVGFVGLASLGGYRMDEWLRVFIAGSRDFTNIDDLAHSLRDQIQSDFQKDFPPGTDVSKKQLVLHLGGYTPIDNVSVPVMYHIWNHESISSKGDYSPGQRDFRITEDVQRNFKDWPQPEDYPMNVRARLQNMVNERRYLWYNNGANLGAFIVFRDFVWQALHTIQDHGFAPQFTGLGARVAFCKMAVELFGSYFTHHFFPEDRVVGGGADVVAMPWPE
jgi:hypothetical protein